ncbi:MAG: hypothetical protein GC136_10510 [Alphaproteobacteria bacterium]|nr:hypothetical protein [Alphaproteobacteria bacterium]
MSFVGIAVGTGIGVLGRVFYNLGKEWESEAKEELAAAKVNTEQPADVDTENKSESEPDDLTPEESLEAAEGAKICGAGLMLVSAFFIAANAIPVAIKADVLLQSAFEQRVDVPEDPIGRFIYNWN